MDDEIKRLQAAKAEFDRKMAELGRRQMEVIEAFAQRSAEERIRKIREEVYGYEHPKPGDGSGQEH